MSDTVVVIAAGEMGSGIGRRLSERGARVLTSLKGRGPGSAARAKAAGMIALDNDNDLVAAANFILSVVPPDRAVALAKRLSGPIKRAGKSPVYIDCNAIAPKTAERIGSVLKDSGCRYIDGGIVGPPPGPNAEPTLYVSGTSSAAARKLADYGLKVRVVEGPVGAASALKMSYAGVTKGLNAIGAAMMLGATRAGCAAALKQELSESQPLLLAWLTRGVPRMFPKAYRWAGEMEEIAAFLKPDKPAHDIYMGMAKFYERLGKGDAKSSRAAEREIAALAEFCSEAFAQRSKAG